MKRKITLLFVMLLTISNLYGVILQANTLQDPIEIEEVQQITEAGTYPVIIRSTVNGIETEKIVYITINFPYTTISETYLEAIDALDIKAENNKLEQYSDSELISLAKAHAWSTKDGSMLSIAEVQREKIADNFYRVKFMTALGTTTEVNMFGYDTLNSQYDYTIMQGQNITLTIGKDARNITIVIGIAILIPFLLLMILFINISKQGRDVLKIFEEKASKK